jgi:hypothetical protein
VSHRGEDAFVGVLLHGVRTADVFIDEHEGACAVGQEGRISEFEPDVYGCDFSPIICVRGWGRGDHYLEEGVRGWVGGGYP